VEDLLAKMSPGALIGLVAVTGGLLCGIVGIVMGCWLEMRKVSATTALKQDMLDRGLSAEDIKTVLEAGSGHPVREAHSHRCSRG
jgi:hypothetical protein